MSAIESLYWAEIRFRNMDPAQRSVCVRVCVCVRVRVRAPRMCSSRIDPEEKRGHLKNRVSVRGEQRPRAYLGKSGGLDDGGGWVNAWLLESEEEKAG